MSIQMRIVQHIQCIRFLLIVGISPLILFACQPVQITAPGLYDIHKSLPSNEMTIRLAGGEWSPYFGENIPHYGCDAWVVDEAFALEGYGVEFGFFPWARSYEIAAHGDWDGTLEWADIPKHREQFYLSSSYLSRQEWAFFYLADQPFDWQTLDDLAGKTIGLTSGYEYSDELKEIRHSSKILFEVASSDKANLQKLLAGRIDIFPMERQVGRVILNEYFTPEEQARIAIHPRPLSEFLPYLLLTKANQQNERLIELFDRGFEQLKSNGRYDQIMDLCVQ